MGLITRRATALLPLSTINPLLSDFACLSEVQSVIQGLCFGYGCVIELAHSDLVYRTRISTRPSFFVRAKFGGGRFHHLYWHRIRRMAAALSLY